MSTLGVSKIFKKEICLQRKNPKHWVLRTSYNGYWILFITESLKANSRKRLANLIRWIIEIDTLLSIFLIMLLYCDAKMVQKIKVNKKKLILIYCKSGFYILLDMSFLVRISTELASLGNELVIIHVVSEIQLIS